MSLLLRRAGWVLLCLALSGLARAQTFAASYRGPADTNTFPRAIAETLDGGNFVAGVFDSRSGVARFDADGNLVWCRTVTSHTASGVVVDPTTGDCLVVGDSGFRRPWVARLSATGVLLWQKEYQVSSFEGSLNAGVGNLDGSFVLTGWAAPPGRKLDMYVLKIDAAGNRLWDRTMDINGGDQVGHEVVKTQNGEYTVVGTYDPVGGDLDCDILLITVDDNGTIGTRRRLDFSTAEDRRPAMAELVSGDLVVAFSDFTDVRVVRTSLGGPVNWAVELDFSNENDVLEDVVPTADGGCVLLVTSRNVGVFDTKLVKLDASGSVLWQKAYSNGNGEVPVSLVGCSAGGFAVAGYTRPAPNELRILRVDDQGSLATCCAMERVPVMSAATISVSEPPLGFFTQLVDRRTAINFTAVWTSTTLLRSVDCATNFGSWTDLGSGLPGLFGTPCLAGVGLLEGGAPVFQILGGARPLSPGLLVLGFSIIDLPFRGGNLVPFPDLVIPLGTNVLGEINLRGTWPHGLPFGFNLYTQYFIVDPSGPQGYSASNAVRATTP